MPRETLIKIREGTTAQWAAADAASGGDPTRLLAAGEFGRDTDLDVLKLGNGVDLFDDLLPVGSGTYAGVYTKVPAVPSGGNDLAGLQAKLDEAIAANVPFELPSSRTYHIAGGSLILDAPYVRMFGGSRRGTRIIQDTANTPILLWNNIAGEGGGASGSHIAGLALEHAADPSGATTQQYAIQVRPNPDGTTIEGGGLYNVTFEDLEIDKAYVGIGAYATGSGRVPIWNAVFSNLKMDRILHSLLRLNGGGSTVVGSPAVLIEHLSGTGGASPLTTDGPALDIAGVRGLVVNGFNLEDWHNKVLTVSGGGAFSINGLRLERHRLTGSTPIVLEVQDSEFSINGWEGSFYQQASTYARIVHATNSHVDMSAINLERDAGADSTTTNPLVLANGDPTNSTIAIGGHRLSGTNFIEYLETGWGTGLFARVSVMGRAPVVDALPAASSTYRGRKFRTEGGSGVPDTEMVCLKDAADAYAWTAVENTLPWTIDIDAFPTAVSQVGWDTLSLDALSVHGGFKASSGNQNDEISFDVLFAPGTWTLELLHHKISDTGIYTLSLDGASLTSLGGSANTIDGYAASTTYNVRSQVTGIVIPTQGKRRLKLKMATNNPSSAWFMGRIAGVHLHRTA